MVDFEEQIINLAKGLYPNWHYVDENFTYGRGYCSNL